MIIEEIPRTSHNGQTGFKNSSKLVKLVRVSIQFSLSQVMKTWAELTCVVPDDVISV